MQDGKAPPAVHKGMATGPTLNISRNKHWRYISLFHGPWLQLPTEVLESLALHNYALLPPRPIDAAVFFDLVKIRRLVDDASNLAVRAANGTTSSSLSASLNAGHNVLGGNGASALGLGIGGGNTRLSGERKFRIRELAVRKLSEAYSVDEVATSVATMQSASALDEVARLVLQRNSKDVCAKYVHFFHEKIPSRMVAQSTSLDVLDVIAVDRSQDPAPLRTRALTKIFKEDYLGAANDLTEALDRYKHQQSLHTSPNTPSSFARRDRTPATLAHGQVSSSLQEVSQWERPSSMQGQLLFQRACVYLSISCREASKALVQEVEKSGDGTISVSAEPDSETLPTTTHSFKYEQANPETMENRSELSKKVRTFAQRALRDYIHFLADLSFSPRNSSVDDLQSGQAHQPRCGNLDRGHDKLSFSMHDARTHDMNHMGDLSDVAPSPTLSKTASGTNDLPCPTSQRKCYQVASLFSSAPPSELLSGLQSTRDSLLHGASNHGEGDDRLSRDAVDADYLTYHPLLNEALHSLLLCHCLIRTPAKEHLRHAQTAARLLRQLDGYPILVPGRASSRTDWIEVLRHADNWLGLEEPWDKICSPRIQSKDGSENQANIPRGNEDIKRDAIIAALSDERVHDEESFQAAVAAREKFGKEQALEDKALSNGKQPPRWKRSPTDDYFLSTERAEIISGWMRHSSTLPAQSSGRRKPRRRNMRNRSNAEGGSLVDNNSLPPIH